MLNLMRMFGLCSMPTCSLSSGLLSIGRVLGISEMFDIQLFKNMPKLTNE